MTGRTDNATARSHAAEAPEAAAGADWTRNSHPIIFFDGVCGLCNRFVDFVIRRDDERHFQFAPLQGETARERLTSEDTNNLSTVVLLDRDGTHRRSNAVVRVLSQMRGGWSVIGFLFAMIPRPLRDLGYRLVSRSRYLLFGKKESCRLPTAEERGRFLP